MEYILIYLVSPIIIILGIVCGIGIYRAYKKGKSLTLPISIGIWVLDIAYLFLVVLPAINNIWVLPFNKIVSLTVGTVILIIGITIMIKGMRDFHSFRRISGLNNSKLITTGIYRFSRNPQHIGMYLMLLGISTIGCSGLSFLLASIAIIIYHLYTVLMEEPYLEKVFGEKYRLYKSKTPRYVGIPCHHKCRKTASNNTL